MKEPKTERMVLNEYDANGKVDDARLMWFVYQNKDHMLPIEEMEQRFVFLDLGEVAYNDPFYPSMSLAQTKKIIEILQGYVDYYEKYKSEMVEGE